MSRRTEVPNDVLNAGQPQPELNFDDELRTETMPCRDQCATPPVTTHQLLVELLSAASACVRSGLVVLVELAGAWMFRVLLA